MIRYYSIEFQPTNLMIMKNPIEANLRAEIDFWRSLIDEWQNSHNDEPVNSRIEEALALAEYKLKKHQMVNSNIQLH